MKRREIIEMNNITNTRGCENKKEINLKIIGKNKKRLKY